MFGSVRRACRVGYALIALVLVVGCSNDPTAKYLENGVPPEDAFVSASARGDEDAVKAFRTAGQLVDARGRQGTTPLMAAAGAGRVDMVELLIGKGADVNVTTSGGWNALIAAAQSGNEPIVRKLLDAGANPNA